MMEIPRYAPREPGGGGLPSIYIDPSHHDHFGGPARSSMPPSMYPPALSSSNPMSIPNRRTTVEDDGVPPPLPPPRFPLQRPTAPPESRSDYMSSLDSSVSWGSPFRGREPSGRPHFDRPLKDEGYHSLTSASSGSSKDSLPSFLSHEHFQFNKPKTTKTSDYDSSLLKKLDPRRTLDHHSPPRKSGLSSSMSDAIPRLSGPESRLNSQLKLNLPIRESNMVIDSPGRLTETPVQSAASSRVPSLLGASSSEHRSPVDPTDMDRSPLMRSRRNNSGSLPDDATTSTQSSFDHYREDSDSLDTSGITRLHIDDGFMRSDGHTVGQKRRASSPPGEDVPMSGFSMGTEMLRRREGVSRASPTPRLTVIPQATLPPVSSTPRSGPYVSTGGLSSISSYGRRSPSGLSPVDICNSPFNMPVSLTHSPHMTLAQPPHQRSLSGEHRQLASPRKVSDMPKPGISKISGGYFMCECCPKKPKKFETDDELRTHEAEKQYECSFCGSRFKNKNEAERHQNSLHVRKNSWSCSALHKNGFDRAFHDSTNRPGEADACGYCGEEFSRNGGTEHARRPTDQDWEERLRHLQEVHKFRECNSSKKFFRADHFRQHLKHSHGGTSGKWTNMLEAACMLEEEPPQPR